MMTIGGLIGFVSGLGIGLMQNTDWPTIILRSTLFACATGLLFRRWGKVFLKCIIQVQEERMIAEMNSETETSNTNTKI